MDDLIKRARELDSKACSGPWRHCCASGDGCGGVMVWEEGDEESPVASASKGHVNAKNNMAFIAESRALLPALADLAESEGRRADEAEAWIAEAQPLIDMLREYQASQGAPMYQAMIKRMLDTATVPGSIKLKGQQP